MPDVIVINEFADKQETQIKSLDQRKRNDLAEYKSNQYIHSKNKTKNITK